MKTDKSDKLNKLIRERGGRNTASHHTRGKIMLETIVEQVIRSTVSQISLSAEKTIREHKTFSDLVSDTKETVNGLACKLLEVIFTAVEQSYDSSRDKHQIVVRNRNKERNLLTEFGSVRLRHTLYYDKQQSRYFFAADELLQIEKYSRIENNLQASLVSNSTITSFGKASTLAGNVVSRQTVHNLVKKLKVIEAEAPKTKWNVQDIYIEADEDHIHLNNGDPAEMKLVYVHEGRENTKERSMLKNPRYFVSIDSDADQIWNDVADYILTNYSAYKSNVHLSGDGAPWIKQGIRIMPHVQYSLDKFHLQKAVTNITSGRKSLQARLRRNIYNGNNQGVNEIVQEICAGETVLSRRREIVRSALYVKGNMPYISRETCCSAEGHVSHVLSARLSSRPMAWSRDGAERMAKLRAFMFNKGDFRRLMQDGKFPLKNSYEILPQKKKNNFVAHRGTIDESAPQQTYSVPGIEKISTGFSQIIKNLINY